MTQPFDFKAWTADVTRIALANLKEGLEDEAAGGPKRAAYLASRVAPKPFGPPPPDLDEAIAAETAKTKQQP